VQELDGMTNFPDQIQRHQISKRQNQVLQIKGANPMVLVIQVLQQPLLRYHQYQPLVKPVPRHQAQ